MGTIVTIVGISLSGFAALRWIITRAQRAETERTAEPRGALNFALDRCSKDERAAFIAAYLDGNAEALACRFPEWQAFRNDYVTAALDFDQ
ncbi:hypothetical protein HGO38_01365 [Rhizobium sp. CG5]|uniref:hypothetical protein n=1 Tax=Rhizobium sp. CG5 TaxID=2726076 RepID=UPI002033842D|nr:hypothetical protein [Rhizobium sp. CG5]MCM2472124.1 hypothetical protein [Rhizobium sp. CG5]